MSAEERAYPRTVICDDSAVEIGLMTPGDGPVLSTFAKELPAHDLLFLRRDISHPKVVAAWMEAILGGRMKGLVGRQGSELVGCSAVVIDELSWSRHVGELRVLVAPSWRGKGLGRVLDPGELRDRARTGVRKVMRADDGCQRGAIAVFESLGFRTEALLRTLRRESITRRTLDRSGGPHRSATPCSIGSKSH